MPEQEAAKLEPTDGPHHPLHDTLLDRLVGASQVTGTIAGRPAEQTCDVEWVLNHQFLRIHFLGMRPATAAGGGAPVQYEAFVFVGYSNMFDHYVVHWLDIFGGHFSRTLGFGERLEGGNAIRFVFEADTPLHNTITWHPEAGTWEMLIRQKDEHGRWTTFGERHFVKLR